jgi:hypothetical protein
VKLVEWLTAVPEPDPPPNRWQMALSGVTETVLSYVKLILCAVVGGVVVVKTLFPGVVDPGATNATRDEASRAGVTCAQFSTQREAQSTYEFVSDVVPKLPDPYGLDTDGDGRACEGLPR